MTDKTLTITGLKLENFAGFRTFDVELDQITVFAGDNGTGKTSLLHAIAAALAPRGGIDQKMINIDAERASVNLQLSGGLEVQKSRKRGKPQRVSVRDGEAEYRRGSELLKSLLDPFCLDPVDWIKGDRTAALLESFPLVITEDEIVQLCGDAGTPPVPAGYDRHAIEVLADVDSGLSSLRKTAKADAKATAGVIKNAEDRPLIADPSEAISEAEAKARAIQHAIDDAANMAEARHGAGLVVNDADDQVERLTGRVADLTAQLQQARDDLTEAAGNRLRARERLDALPVPPDVSAERARLTAANVLVTELTETRGAYNQQLKDLGRIEVERETLAGLATTIAATTEALARIRAKPGELLAAADLPIPGLAYRRGELTLNGKPVSGLSNGETIRLAAQVAAHRVQSQRGQFILVDGLEQLDNKSLAALVEEMRASAPIRWVCTGVGERDYGEGVMVVVMGQEAGEESS